MPKRIFWKQTVIKQSALADELTTRNIQPGKFVIAHVGLSKILLLYVDKEIPNAEFGKKDGGNSWVN